MERRSWLWIWPVVAGCSLNPQGEDPGFGEPSGAQEEAPGDGLLDDLVDGFEPDDAPAPPAAADDDGREPDFADEVVIDDVAELDDMGVPDPPDAVVDSIETETSDWASADAGAAVEQDASAPEELDGAAPEAGASAPSPADAGTPGSETEATDTEPTDTDTDTIHVPEVDAGTPDAATADAAVDDAGSDGGAADDAGSDASAPGADPAGTATH